MESEGSLPYGGSQEGRDRQDI